MIDRYGVEVSGQLLWADGLFPFALDQPQPLVGRCPRFLILPASSGAAPPSKPRTSNPSSPPLRPVASSYYPWSKIIDELADQILEAVRLEILKMKRPDSASGRLLSHGTVQTLL